MPSRDGELESKGTVGAEMSDSAWRAGPVPPREAGVVKGLLDSDSWSTCRVSSDSLLIQSHQLAGVNNRANHVRRDIDNRRFHE
jgi:hypothetical protein